ncbi:sigma-70 family RNA polymerase sigma factor [Leifsonia sp. 2MCAF36]|uniref:sigma-70 family RNA polymerase sigma factor n=1 Tax=Leifsonia sp. 2MCAF36 TaxID=3232988 RepID=UPI003F9A6C85
MTRELDDLSDADLLSRARDGESPAFGVLWKRHWPAARAMAASVTARFEPEDLASEAFARILSAVEKGKGPTSGFRAYLAKTVRNVAIDWSRRKATTNIEDPDSIEDWSYSELTALDNIERETITKAFYTLPDSWQEVLWYMQVEDMTPREAAPLIGMTPNAASSLSARAREGLRQAWIGAHLAEVPPGNPVHAWTITRLGAHVRGKLSKSDRRKLTEHLDECDTCSNAAVEAESIGSRLALSLLPLFLGVAGAAAYTEWVNSSSSAVAATASGAASSAPGARAGDGLAVTGAATHAGLAAVAASVVMAAVLTAGTILTAQQGDSSIVRSSDTNTVPPGKGAAAEGSGDSERGPAPSDPGPDPTAAERDGEREAPPATSQPGFVADEAPSDELGVDREPGAPEALSGREAAVRTIPADDTLFAYRLGEGTTGTAEDFIHNGTAQYDESADGSTWALRDGPLRQPSDVFSVQIWFRATTGGGRLLGFSSAEEGLSSAYDRHLFLSDDGRLVFGVFPNSVRTIASSRSYLDNSWHQATATLSPQGMSLYVDGERVAQDEAVTTAQAFAGYWRVGYDNLDNWGPDTPSRRAFAGDLEYAAVYGIALTPEQIRAQWELGR